MVREGRAQSAVVRRGAPERGFRDRSGTGGRPRRRRFQEASRADNRQRAIVLAKAGEFRVFVYLFAKKDRANIDDAELAAFRKLANLYRGKTEADIDADLMAGALWEIGDDRTA